MTVRVALVSCALVAAAVATVTGAPKRMVSVSDDDGGASAAAAPAPARSDRCAALRAHVEALVGAELSGRERAQYAREAEARAAKMTKLCHKTRPSKQMMQCLLRAKSLDAMTACSTARMRPAQRAVHDRLLRALDSDDPAAIAGAVTQSLELDPRQAARMRKMIEDAIRAGDEP